MGADGRADGGPGDVELGVELVELGGDGIAVLGGVCVAHAGNVPVGLELARLLEEVDDLTQALLATARHAANAEGSVEVEVQQRLHVEGVTDDGNSLGQAAATVQCVEVVDHEDRVQVVARLLGPGNELLGVKALVPLAASLLDEQREGRRGHERVDDVDPNLLAGVLLLQALQGRAGSLVAAGKSARDAEQDRGHAALVGLLEGLVILELGGLRRHGHGTVANGVVELVGTPGLEQVVVPGQAAVGLARLDVVKRKDLHIELARHLWREVARGVCQDPADCTHGSLPSLKASRGVDPPCVFSSAWCQGYP